MVKIYRREWTLSDFIFYMYCTVFTLFSKSFRTISEINLVRLPTCLFEKLRDDDCFDDMLCQTKCVIVYWWKLLRLDLQDEPELISTSSTKLGFGTSAELKTLITVSWHQHMWISKACFKIIDKPHRKNKVTLSTCLQVGTPALSQTQFVLDNTSLNKRFFANQVCEENVKTIFYFFNNSISQRFH